MRERGLQTIGLGWKTYAERNGALQQLFPHQQLPFTDALHASGRHL